MALIKPKTVDLDLSDYSEGLAATMRYNFAWASQKDYFSGDEDRARAALVSWVVSWNFEDEDGAIPPTVEGMQRVPTDLVLVLTEKFWAAVAERRKAALPPLPAGGSAPSTASAT